MMTQNLKKFIKHHFITKYLFHQEKIFFPLLYNSDDCFLFITKLFYKFTVLHIATFSFSSSASIDYNELLHKSILFYEAQKSGRLPITNRIPWRGDADLKDGCPIHVDLTGGWYNGKRLLMNIFSSLKC